jgi:hypothetical protein
MSKLYYTDPLKAAMMARDSGVKYTAGRPVYDKYEQEDYYNFFEHECDGYPECPTREYIRPQGLTKWHIHPDSYHIFEPQEGDMLLFDDKPCFTDWASRKRPYEDNEQVVMRNNTAFFMPIKDIKDD